MNAARKLSPVPSLALAPTLIAKNASVDMVMINL
jgi:hypothetical protein